MQYTNYQLPSSWYLTICSNNRLSLQVDIKRQGVSMFSKKIYLALYPLYFYETVLFLLKVKHASNYHLFASW
jgi:hypothetical protein